MFGDQCTVENGCLQMVAGKHKEGLLPNTYDKGGGINDDIVESLTWKPVLSGIRDLVVFDSYTPHKVKPTQQTNHVEYFILHLIEKVKGNIMKIILKKREMLPPDIEKDNSKVYNQNSKYNLANPISYSKL